MSAHPIRTNVRREQCISSKGESKVQIDCIILVNTTARLRLPLQRRPASCTTTCDLIGINTSTYCQSPTYPTQTNQKQTTNRYSLASQIHQVELNTIIYHLQNHGILLELMYQRCDLQVEDKLFGGATAIPDNADMDTIDDGC